MEKEIKSQTSGQPLHKIQKGPIEGIEIVNGRPRMECSDMPSISFESILALQRFLQVQQGQQNPSEQSEDEGRQR